ncbi:MAG: HAD family hydrolase [Candidatus Zixiibacteriota bacterium]
MRVVVNTKRAKIERDRISTLLFDLDGVLIESISGIVDSTNHCLSSLGLPARTPGEIMLYIGSPLPRMFSDFAPDVDYDLIRPLFRERARQVIVPSSNLLPHARETLDSCKAAGYRIGIGSTKIRGHIEGIIDKFSLGKVVDAFVGGDEAKPKPEPDIFLLAAERLDSEPDSTLVIGDTVNDVQAARQAGMSVVTVESEFGDRSFLTHEPSDFHFADLFAFGEFALESGGIER